jgi:hypothetical protein
MMESAEDASLQERHIFNAVFGSDNKATTVITPDTSTRNNVYDKQRLCLGKSPREVFFFKSLHAEFRKVTAFFEKRLDDFVVREEKIRQGLEILSEPESVATTESWVSMAYNIYGLYKDLLLLESYAIMSYCGFSKILKKKDKCTGVPTRAAFMTQFVERANFFRYPRLLEMIQRCQFEYDEVSRFAVGPLFEDQRLFLDMILKMNAEATGIAIEEGGQHMSTVAAAESNKRDFLSLLEPSSSLQFDDLQDCFLQDDYLSTYNFGDNQNDKIMRPSKRVRL